MGLLPRPLPQPSVASDNCSLGTFQIAQQRAVTGVLGFGAVVKEASPAIREHWVQIQTLAPLGCVTLGKWLKLAVPTLESVKQRQK